MKPVETVGILGLGKMGMGLAMPEIPERL